MAITQGTRVRLTQAHGIGTVGDEGVVTGIDDAGDFTIAISNRADCSLVSKLLLGVPPGKLATDTRCG